MKKSLLICLLLNLVVGIVVAQSKSVYFDYEKSSFNENSALPAESFLMVYGAVSSDVPMVRIDLLNSSSNKTVTYSASWKRPQGLAVNNFAVPFNQKLRSNNQESFAIKYYREITQEEQEILKTDLMVVIDAYLDQSLQVSKRKLNLTKQTPAMIKELNKIVIDGMQYYESKSYIEFVGFSDIVRYKLEQIEGVKLKKAKFFSSKESNSEAKVDYRVQLMGELHTLIETEVRQMMRTDLLTIKDIKYVYDYPVENTKNTVALTLGYQGVIFGKTNGTSLDYGGSPAIGVSIPFGKREFRKKFWNNLSLDFGVLLLNMEDANGETISGPVIKRPLYGGLGLKLFKFVKVQAGYTLVEYQPAGNNSFFDSNNIAARPFVGAGIQINFWADFAK